MRQRNVQNLHFAQVLAVSLSHAPQFASIHLIPVILLRLIVYWWPRRQILANSHLIPTPVFTSFKPPRGQSEASRMGGGSTSADVSRKIFRIEVTSATEYKYFPIEEIIQNENIWRVTSEWRINNCQLKKYLRKHIYILQDGKHYPTSRWRIFIKTSCRNVAGRWAVSYAIAGGTRAGSGASPRGCSEHFGWTSSLTSEGTVIEAASSRKK